jgi:CheY-like chemotaxis protein
MTLRVVIADDDVIQRKLVVARFRNAGYEVTAAADGQEALALIRESRPDVVVSDVLMLDAR